MCVRYGRCNGSSSVKNLNLEYNSLAFRQLDDWLVGHSGAYTRAAAANVAAILHTFPVEFCHS
jgi:hypothetical protein